MAREIVHLVPHTHWDREWYEPFQRFRLRLVDLLDDVIERAEADPGFHFTLDGQTAAVDDYLEVRPEAAPRIAALVRRGQFAIGPWAILMDEFLCSGENIVRNLELGLRRAAGLGGAMPVGYLPDMFGHCAQMPQILAGAGLRQACVWRGVPAAITWHAFVWRAPDGTGVRTEYLPGGYGNAADMFAGLGPDDGPDGLEARVAAHLRRMRDWYGGDPVLAMYGTDHSAPLPGLSAAAAGLGADSPVRLSLDTLAGYLSRYEPADAGLDAALQVWQGELRSHARANILPGVLSNRPHLKRALSAAERMVERYAEPLTALWAPAGRWPARLLEMAWRRLIESSCHDSVTGCGVDETAVQVAARIAEAEQIGRGVRDRTLAALAARVPAAAVLVVNPSPYPRVHVVRLTVPLPDPAAPGATDASGAAGGITAPGAIAGTGGAPLALRLPDGARIASQPVSAAAGAPLFQTVRPAAEVAAGLRRGSLGLDFLGEPVRDVAADPARVLTVTVGPGGAGVTGAHRSLAEAVGASGGDWALRVFGPPEREVFAAVPVPALGFTTVRADVSGAPVDPPAYPVAVDHTVRTGDPGRSGGPDREPRWQLANGLLRVLVAGDGTLTLSGPGLPTVTGAGRLVDTGDAGDLYNFAPAPGDGAVAVPRSVAVRAVHAGPLVGAVEVRRTYPAGTRDGATEITTEVSTLVELRAGEPFCRLAIGFTNRLPDHRVRLHVPLPEPADRSYAQGQFAVVARGLTSEGGHGEVPLPTFPAYGFVAAGGVAVLLEQVSEYELVDGGREVAITLLRATGVISRPDHPLRAEPAGPVIATPDAQWLDRPVFTRLALAPHAGDWAVGGVPVLAEAFGCPAVAVGGAAPLDAGPATAGLGGTGLSVTGPGVSMTSLRRRDADRLELRVVALTDTPTEAVVAPVTDATRADLLGHPGASLPVVAGTVRVPLRPWEIATLSLVVPAPPVAAVE